MEDNGVKVCQIRRNSRLHRTNMCKGLLLALLLLSITIILIMPVSEDVSGESVVTHQSNGVMYTFDNDTKTLTLSAHGNSDNEEYGHTGDYGGGNGRPWSTELIQGMKTVIVEENVEYIGDWALGELNGADVQLLGNNITLHSHSFRNSNVNEMCIYSNIKVEHHTRPDLTYLCGEETLKTVIIFDVNVGNSFNDVNIATIIV